ncbi:hypothetical protein AMTRI_Chr04g253440 [Amborella trichopoda]
MLGFFSLSPTRVRRLTRFIIVSSSHSFATTHFPLTSTTTTSKSREETLLSLLNSCFCMRDLHQLHAQIIQTGFDQNVFIMSKILTFCAISVQGSVDYALLVFHQMKHPDGFIWNTMIRGLGRFGNSFEAFRFYQKMRQKGEAIDNFTMSFLLKICAQDSVLELGKQVHCTSIKHGLDSHVFVLNTLIHMYAMCRDIQSANQLFKDMPIQDLVSWNTIIDGYVQCGQSKEALRMFIRMQGIGVEPDEATIVTILLACANIGALEFGRWVHYYSQETGLDGVVSVCNSLIDMYGKCGGIEHARKIFDNMPCRNIVTWNAMIMGLAMHGHALDALKVFDMMQRLGREKPNDVTFLGVLCACSHGGLIDLGRQNFEKMERASGVKPRIKHYGCMVDLLGRAGFVEEAYELIERMPIECNAVVWRALLGACRVHGKMELGEVVRKRLMEIEPEHSGDYVLLANLYASLGRWDDAVEVRREMRDRGVRKVKPGNSLIDMDVEPGNSLIIMDVDSGNSLINMDPTADSGNSLINMDPPA